MQQRSELDLTQDPRNLAASLKKMSDEAKGPFLDKWAQNLKHAAGFLTDVTRTAQAALVGGGLNVSTFVTDNRFGAPTPVDVLRPILTRYLGRNMQLMGGWRVIPRNNTQEDKDQSEAAEKILDSKWDTEDLDVVTMEAFLLAQSCSHGYVFIEGDDTIGPEERFMIDGGAGVPEERVKKTGDVSYWSFSPFQIDVVPGARSLESSPVIAIHQFITEEDYVRRWGKLPDGAEAKRAKYEQGHLDEIEPAIGKGMIEITRLFKRQSKQFPRGEQYIIVGKAAAIPVKDAKGNTYMGTYNSGTEEQPKYEYPVVDFRDEPLRLGYWGLGRQSAARPILKTLCALWSRLAHIASLPLFMGLPEGSQIAVDEIPDVPFFPVEFNPSAGKPDFMQVPGMENIYKMIDQCLRWLGEIYSQHESSRGVAQGSRFPAEGIRMLQEQDMLADSPAGKMAIKAISRLGTKTLGEGLRVWSEQYKVIVLGDENQAQQYTLNKKSLYPGIDVRVIPGNEHPKSKQALIKEITELARYGIIDPKAARKLVGAQTADDVYRTDQHHLEKIKSEEMAFERFEDVPVHWADDNALHIEHHERRAIERALIARPEEDAARRKHNERHLEAEKARAEAELQQQIEAARAAQMGPAAPQNS